MGINESPFSTAHVRSKLKDNLSRVVEHVTLGIAAVNRLPEGPTEFQEAFFNIEFTSPPLCTKSTRDGFMRWLIRMGLREGIDLLSHVVDDVRILAGLSHKASDDCVVRLERATTAAELVADLRRQELKSFHTLDWPRKLTTLSREFGVNSEFGDELRSINKARNCLTHRDGVIGTLDINDSSRGALVVKYRAIELDVKTPAGRYEVMARNRFVEAGSRVRVRAPVPKELIFPVGSRVQVSAQEFVFLVFTIWVFGESLIASLEVKMRQAGKHVARELG